MNLTFYPTMRNASHLKGILIKTKDGGDLRLKHVSADHTILAKVCEIFEQRHGVEFAYYGDAPPPEDRGSAYPVVWRCRKARSEGMVDVELLFDGPTQTYSDPQVNADLAAFAPRKAVL